MITTEAREVIGEDRLLEEEAMESANHLEQKKRRRDESEEEEEEAEAGDQHVCHLCKIDEAEMDGDVQLWSCDKCSFEFCTTCRQVELCSLDACRKQLCSTCASKNKCGGCKKSAKIQRTHQPSQIASASSKSSEARSRFAGSGTIGRAPR